MVQPVAQKHVTCSACRDSKAEPGPSPPGPTPTRTCQIPHATKCHKISQLESHWCHFHINFSCLHESNSIRFCSRFCCDLIKYNRMYYCSLLFSDVCCSYCAQPHHARLDLLVPSIYLPSIYLDCIRPHAIDWSSFHSPRLAAPSAPLPCTLCFGFHMFDIIRAPSSRS